MPVRRILEFRGRSKQIKRHSPLPWHLQSYLKHIILLSLIICWHRKIEMSLSLVSNQLLGSFSFITF